jgi:murein L,D-transpeptidase YafK
MTRMSWLSQPFRAAGPSCPERIQLGRVGCVGVMFVALTGASWTGNPIQTALLAADDSERRADGNAEAKLFAVYRLIGENKNDEAMTAARALVADFPNFQLAQLVYGDLLTARTRPLLMMGDVKGDLPAEAGTRLGELREESRLRIAALKERPPSDAMPSSLLTLSPRNKHAIVVDVSKSRLYLFEHAAGVLRLLADYYVSVGKAGVEKSVEGDRRTPLGIYFITSSLDPKGLSDLYGAGALPINYPNAWDVRRGKSGGGIWLHGTPAAQFSRAPMATDGCVAISNPDLRRILHTVAIPSTPVVIERKVQWVKSHDQAAAREDLGGLLNSWARAKSTGEIAAFSRFYAKDFTADEKVHAIHQMLKKSGSRPTPVRLQDISLLRMHGDAPLIVATFGEVDVGEKGGRNVRQYWEQRDGRWQIVYEGILGSQVTNGPSFRKLQRRD